MKRLILTLCLVCAITTRAQDAAGTFTIATPSTAGATSYASGAFTPAAGTLLVAFVLGAATVATGTMTDSQSLGFTKVNSALFGTNANTLYCFVSNALAANASMTVTFDCTGDTATGADIHVYAVSGMTKLGLAAIRQSAKQENITAGTTPAPVFSISALTDNLTLGAVTVGANPAAMTPPTGWTEGADDGFNTPSAGQESVFRNSGFTGTTVTWGSTLGGAISGGALIVELDTSSQRNYLHFF